MKLLRICTAHSHLNRRKTLLALMIITLITSLLGTMFAFNTNVNDKTVSADSVFYDFVTQASTASWGSGAGSLLFPGSDNDSRGFACYRDNWQLEDGSTWAKALETHPQWVSNGWIMGRYPQLTVPSGADLKVTVGFLKGATGTDGVTFEVQFEEGQSRQTILSLQATYDSKLDSTTKSLSSLAGRTGYFILYVNAGQSSGKDWAAWAEAKIEVAAPAALPNLIVEDVWQVNNTIRYKIKNVGEGSIVNPLGGTTPFCNALFIDGELVAKDCVNIHEMMPGQWIDNPFDYYWEMTPPEHEIKVCADWDEDVAESNEQNNCWEQVWTMEEELPDLIIEEIKCDRENSRIGYVIRNVGGATAPSGHATTLYVDGKEISHDVMDYDLESDVIYRSWFQEYTWPECHTIEVRVCADNYEQIEESNEQNNCKEQVCECVADIIPPVIISGPTVSQIGPTMAVICWETDEASDSLVRYDNRAGEYGSVAQDSNLVREHCLKLSNLNSATTYHFVVESQDSSGNSVSSRDLNFETLSPSDDENPSLSLTIPDTLSGKATIPADAQDNTGVDRVVFFLDGKPTYMDYSSPFGWELDTGVLDEGSHNFAAKAFDLAGNIDEATRKGNVQNHFPVDLSPVHVQILTPEVTPPERRAKVYGEVPIGVRVTHDLDYGIKNITVKVVDIEVGDEEIICEKPYSKGYYMEMGPGLERIWVVTGYPEPPVYETCDWDAGVEWDSEYLIEVNAEDGHGNLGHASRLAIIARPVVEAKPLPYIKVTREVVRNGNYFDVYLTIENKDEAGDIDNLRVIDTNEGFQGINTGWIRSKAGDGEWLGERPIEYEVSIHPSGRPSTVTTGNLGTLRTNEAIKLKYSAVPVLLSPWVAHTYSFGQVLEVRYQFGDREYHKEYLPERSPTTWWSSSTEVNRAFRDADYLIVTNPAALFATSYHHDDVNELLSTMAELAKEKNGVLGDIAYGVYAYTLKAFISPGGEWYEKLAPFDYLLIVGETEIVPSFTEPCHVHFSGHGTCPICGAENVRAVTSIRITDFPYADIEGDDTPELKVGRIIGSSAQELTKPIQASIDVYNGRADYDASDAYLVTGPEGTWEMFVYNLDQHVMWALFDEGIEHVTVDYMAEFYTEQHGLLQEALQIRHKEPTELKGENATWGNYTTNELACWLSLIEDEDVIMDQIPYQPDWLTTEIIVRGADGYVSQDVLEHALEIAAEIEHNRRGIAFHEYTYDHWTSAQRLQHVASSVKSGMPGKDIIIFSGHGGPGSWACVLDDWRTSDCPVEPISFGSTCPVVIAFSCLTGNYDGSESIARAFLRNNAAVYIGATEVSPCSHNDRLETQEFWNYWSKTSRIGDAWFGLKTWMLEQDNDWWRYVAYEYNLYGDPKFGGP